MSNISKTFVDTVSRFSPQIYFMYNLTVKAGLCYGYYKYVFPKSYQSQARIYRNGAIVMLPIVFLSNVCSYLFGSHFVDNDIIIKSVCYSAIWPYALNVLLTNPDRFIDSKQDTVSVKYICDKII